MNCERFYRAKLFARALAAANLLRRRAGFQNTVQMQATLHPQARRSSSIRLLQSVLIAVWTGVITTGVCRRTLMSG
jgi:hypothetical protein